MKRIQLFVVWLLVMVLCLPIQANAVGGIGTEEISGDVAAILVYCGVPYTLSSVQLSDLERNGLDWFLLENKIPVAEQVSPMNQPGDINTYYESSGRNDLRYNKAVYVTPAVEGPATITYGESQTITSSFSLSLTLPIKLKVVSELVGNFSYSVTTNREFSVAFEVTSGRQARVQFVPMMRHTIGTYYYDSFTSYDIDAYIPLKVNSFADGLYRLVYISS